MESKDLQLIDTHCHLFVEEFDLDRDAVIQHALDAGVKRMMLPNIDQRSLGRLLEVCNQYMGICFPMLGLHPCSVMQDYRDVLGLLREKLDQHEFVGIGETGIDLYWDTSHQVQQRDAFEQQIEWAKQYQLPVIIHSRESLDLNISIIRQHQDGTLRGIFHCFGGTVEQGVQIAALGFHMGIGGIITYKNSLLSSVMQELPLSSIVLETDAPYLPPVPYRGKRNQPGYLLEIAGMVSQSLSLPIEEVARITRENAEEVFKKKR